MVHNILKENKAKNHNDIIRTQQKQKTQMIKPELVQRMFAPVSAYALYTL